MAKRSAREPGTDLMCDAPGCENRAEAIVHDEDGTPHGRCATHMLFGVEE